MIVPDSSAVNSYVGNAVTTQFPYTFAIVDEAEIEVLSNGTVLVLNSNYVVSGVGVEGGGVVTITPPPGSAVIITLLRKQTFKQSSVYQNNEDFPAKRLEKDLNKVVMALQQLKEVSGRSLKFLKQSLLTNPILPDGVVGMVLRWKTTTELENISTTVFAPGAVTLPLSIANGGTASATAAAARAALVVAGLADENTFTKGQHWSEGVAIASASTLAPGTDGNFFHVTGAIAITQIGASAASPLFLAFDGTPVLTHDVTKLVLRDSANVTVAAGNVFGFVYEGGIIWREIFRSQVQASTLSLGHLGGLGLSNNGVDPTNDIDFAVGEAVSDDALITNRVLLNAGVMTKQLDAVWAAGTGAGGRAAADNLTGAKTFQVWIFRRTGGVDDYFFSTSLTPTIPDSGTKKRYIGQIVWNGSTILGFIQDGDYFRLKTSVLDVDDAAPGVAAKTGTLASIPAGRKVKALLNVGMYSGTGTGGVYISDLDTVDQAPSATIAPGYTIGTPLTATSPAAFAAFGQVEVMTNTLAQFRYRGLANSNYFRAVSLGWTDRRGRG